MTIAKVRYALDTASQVSLCIVDDLSEELKQILRSELSKVCHGVAKATASKNIYSYQRTVKEFLKRYRDKTPDIKTGMIGELLCHILLFNYRPHLKPASPYFNMEEASIKKGFDLIVTNKTDNSLWIAEVKSGGVGESEKHKKIRSLIDLAKNDLIKRVSSENPTLWHSAINNVELAVESGTAEKEILLGLVESFLDASETKTTDLSTLNVILVPILFETTIDELDFGIIRNKYEKLAINNPFGAYTIFAIQKSTITKVEDFLQKEAIAA
jgi:hypothetical protein